MLAAGHPVKITCIYPGGVRTAIMRNSTWAAGYDGAAIQRAFEQHVARTSVDDAARKILRGISAGKAKILVGPDAIIADLLARVTGAGYQRIVSAARAAHERRTAGQQSEVL
jgi:short-subunit dehydrogenase